MATTNDTNDTNDNLPRITSASDLLAAYAAGRRDFHGAKLTRADLSGAVLTDAELTRAHLRGANLTRADLSGADLSGAVLSGADLTDATLARANLTDANLSYWRDDVLALCRLMPAEVPGLLAALEAGRVDGSIYQDAERQCGCLVGTLANCRGVDVQRLPELVPGLTIDSGSPRERWFMLIHKGDTPANSQVVAVTAGWLRALLAELTGATPQPPQPEATA